MTINQTILELRREKGLSQKNVADAVGISQSTIAKIEINRNEATASTIRKLADFFGVSADYILGRTDELGVALPPIAPQLSNEDREILSLFHALTPEYQAVALTTLRSWAGVPAAASSKKKA